MKRLIGFLIVITLMVGMAGSAHAATCVTARRSLTGEVPKTLTIMFNEAENPSCQLVSVVVYMGTGNWLQRTTGLICSPSMDNWVGEGTDEVTINFDPPLEVGDSRTTCIADNLGFYLNSGQSIDATINCLGTFSTYSAPFDNFYDVTTYKTWKISEATVGTCGELPPPGEDCFDFNDGTDQGWTLEGALDEDGDGPFANNFSFWWSDATNYPNPPCNDPMGDNNGSISFFTANNHGINNPGAVWFIMQMYSPDLSGMPVWQNADGYTCAISENMAFMGTLYANLFVRVYDIDAGTDVWLYSGAAQPLSHDVCGDSDADWNYMEFDWSEAPALPTNYIVRQIHLNFFGNMQSTGYEGGVYIDEVCAIPGEVEPEECYPDLPDPELVVECKYLGTGSDGNSYWYYNMNVTNYAAYPDVLFEPAPDLPPCGLNTNSSRTWVEIFAEGGQRIYGFCGLNSAAALNIIWFAVADGQAPPDNVYIEIWDRRCDIVYTSNLASTDVPNCDDECEQPMLTLEGYREVDWNDPIWEVQVEVLNHGPGVAYNVTATMNTDIPWLIIPDPTCHYGNIPEGSSSWGLDSYSFDLTNSPGGSFNVWFDLSYEDDCGNQYQLRLDPEFDRDDDAETTPLLSYDLVQNYPNPFNPNTSISFQIQEPGHVDLRIYDVTGRLIRTLVNNHRTAGNHTVHWDGKDSQGIAVSSGIYFYKIQAGRFIDTKRMVLLR